MPYNVLLINPVLPSLDKQLSALYTVHRYYEHADKAGFLREVGAHIEGVVTGGATGISNELMDALPALRIVAVNGIGTDAVDLEPCSRPRHPRFDDAGRAHRRRRRSSHRPADLRLAAACASATPTCAAARGRSGFRSPASSAA